MDESEAYTRIREGCQGMASCVVVNILSSSLSVCLPKVCRAREENREENREIWRSALVPLAIRAGRVNEIELHVSWPPTHSCAILESIICITETKYIDTQF
jgi:hypothetical protein